jgi:hypothetical protein
MPTRLNTNFPALTDSDEFESMIRDICALEWNDPNTDKFGRKGQKQYGVDVYRQSVDLNGKYRAAQCKLRTKKEQLTEQEIEAEVGDANKFPHELDTLIIATDAPRDTYTQILVDQISQREMSRDSFRVVIWFWDNITERLAAYPKLIVKYYPDFYANLTTLPVVERLIDTPLQIVSVTQSPSNTSALIEDALKFRGIRILKPDNSETASANLSLNDVLPDGVLCSCNSSVANTTDSALLKFAGTVQNHIHQVESPCPVFVTLPFSLTTPFLQSFATLGGDPQKIQILNIELPTNGITDRILQDVFHYGYTRRGGLATIDIAIRTREGRPGSILLDLDWQARLSTSRFPTPTEWKDTLVPALTAARSQLLNQSDRTRIQINCQLPLPAAFALGFFFNMRIARVGVWARKTEVSDFKQQFWLSDGDPADVTFVPEWIKHPGGSNQTAVVELTSYVSIHKPVEAFAQEIGLVPDVWLQMRMSKEGATIANIEENFAVAYANQVGQVIRYLNEQGITDIHLFARVPSPLAILIGQRLQACGRIHLYWFDNPTYRFAFTLV